MKRLFCLILLSQVLTGRLQAQAYEGDVQFDKKKQPAILIDYRYPAQAVENAFNLRMEKLGFKAKEEKGILNRDKGFLVYKNAYITDISTDRLDYIIRVDRKSRKENDESTLYLVIQKDGDNAINKLDAYDIGRAKAFLNDMIPDIEAANLELQIKEQEDSYGINEEVLR